MIHVCSLARLNGTVEDTGARHVVSLLGDEANIERPRRPSCRKITCGCGCTIFHEPLDGYIVPGEAHVANLLSFVRRWDRRAPLVVHCYMGISRSTASAFATVCALNPHRAEESIARALRAASPTATPNIRIVSLADRLLGRGGRMVAAIERSAAALSSAAKRRHSGSSWSKPKRRAPGAANSERLNRSDEGSCGYSCERPQLGDGRTMAANADGRAALLLISCARGLCWEKSQ